MTTPGRIECEIASPISDHPMCVIQQLKSPQTMAVAIPVMRARCMNAYWRMSTSGMEHLLNVGIFGNTKVLQKGISRKNFF